MSHPIDTYRRNAEAARTEAEQSPLPQLRARAAIAAKTWAAMADRQEKYEAELKQREAAMIRRKVEANG